MSEPRILVVGSTMMDLIAYAQRLPEVGETLVGDRFQMGFGGKGANQAVMAARFGAPVAMVNAVGNDAYGSAHMENFEIPIKKMAGHAPNVQKWASSFF